MNSPEVKSNLSLNLKETFLDNKLNKSFDTTSDATDEATPISLLNNKSSVDTELSKNDVSQAKFTTSKLISDSLLKNGMRSNRTATTSAIKKMQRSGCLGNFIRGKGKSTNSLELIYFQGYPIISKQ